MATHRPALNKSRSASQVFDRSSPLHSPLFPGRQCSEVRNFRGRSFLSAAFNSSKRLLWHRFPSHNGAQISRVVCFTGTDDVDTKECVRTGGDSCRTSRLPIGHDIENEKERFSHSRLGLAEACRYVQNDAKFMNERARNDIVLLSRGIMRLDARARQDVAILSSEFLKLDARAREDTGKIDRGMKKKAERLQHIVAIIKDEAGSRLKTVADKHWSDGALEADLRLADIRAKQRAMEDSLMALEFIKSIHDMMVRKMNKLSPIRAGKDSISSPTVMGRIMLEKNGKTLDFLQGEMSADRVSAIQKAYWSMASALSEADGIDYTDPEELELVVTTLIDLDAMDGKDSVSLLEECSNSPDVSTRQALASALAAAPSMWTLGNAGMGALQRLAEDSNPSIARAATKAIYELKRQWEIEEGDSWRLTMDQSRTLDDSDSEQ
ncbi:hypothetical protein MLD38_024400 [Melastoma candidum]|uniref:Uncharacterized protein n=1 Tax=Melastoma candidum TaxID=119954 RepID=A0ACB9NT38_9MYRT|nr:hypothetical protein MLD38_024400 [Melastoma candidum]